MKREDLMKASSEINDTFIMESESENLPEEEKRRSISLIQILAVLAVLIVFASGRFSGGSGGSGAFSDNGEYAAYTGPVLPVLADQTDEFTVSRSIHFDFEQFMQEQKSADGFVFRDTDIPVEETYLITNNSLEERTVTLKLPYVSVMEEYDKYRPEVYADGEQTETELLIGNSATVYDPRTESVRLDEENGGFATVRPRDYQAYLDMLNTESKGIPKASIDPDQTVTVYEMNVAKKNPGEEGCAFLIFECDDEETFVIGELGNTGNIRGDGTHALGFWTDQTRNFWIVFGNDIRNVRSEVHRNMAEESEEISDDFDIQIERSEMKLEDFLTESISRYIEDPMTTKNIINEDDYRRTVLNELSLLGMIEVHGKRAYDMNEDLFTIYDFIQHMEMRIFYLEWQMTFAPNQSMRIDISALKKASSNFRYSDKGKGFGYGFVTYSDQSFSLQSLHVSASSNEQIRSFRGNTGLNPSEGISENELDPSVPYYWIEAVW